MALNIENRPVRFPSLGMDAVDYEPYSDTRTMEGDLMIYDEQSVQHWMQSDFWLPLNEME